MNKTEQAQQLRLAAELIETGHPWHLYRAGRLYDTNPHMSAAYYAANRNSPEGPFEIRPILATPPDGRPLHNPDKLTAEQVGVGYRLALIDEKTNENEALQEFWNKGEWMTSGRVYSDTFGEAPNHRITYRLPLSVPWPEVKPDPYAELKAAHAAGKAIEVQMPNGEWFDYKPDKPQWNLQPECYRIKPEPATKEVELGPEDVPPGSVVLSSSAGCNGTRWESVACAKTDGVEIYGRFCIPWSELFTHWKINRSIPLTSKWNPDAWEPCHKTLANG